LLILGQTTISSLWTASQKEKGMFQFSLIENASVLDSDGLVSSKKLACILEHIRKQQSHKFDI
jgi:hypothetical protein